MQLMSIKIGLLSVLLLKTCVRKKGGLGGLAPQTLTRSYYFEPPLSKKRSRATDLGKRQCVSKDRLKPAYLANNEQDENMNNDFPKFPPSSSSPMLRHSGRKVHFPGYLKDFVMEGREHCSSGYNIRTDIADHARCMHEPGSLDL